MKLVKLTRVSRRDCRKIINNHTAFDTFGRVRISRARWRFLPILKPRFIRNTVSSSRVPSRATVSAITGIGIETWKIFSHSSTIAKLGGGKKAWEYLLPSGFGFTQSILSVSNAVEVDEGYVLKGLISLPSATIGKRKNCFEIHLDKEMILRKAVIQYHVYDFVIVTSGRSEFDGMPPLAKLVLCRFTMLAKMKNDQAMLETISMK